MLAKRTEEHQKNLNHSISNKASGVRVQEMHIKCAHPCTSLHMAMCAAMHARLQNGWSLGPTHASPPPTRAGPPLLQ